MSASTSIMRPPAALVALRPFTKFEALQATELQLEFPRATRLAGPWLWRVPAEAAALGQRCEALVGVQQVLLPLVRASSFDGLLAALASEPPAPRTWTLHYAAHSRRALAAGSGAPRATDYLCAVAQRLAGAPALGAAGGAHLVLVRTPRMWYLAEDVHREARLEEGAEDAVWASRPYSFSAATDLGLARLAVSLGVLSARRGADEPPLLLDPCCGSGTVLYAAACRGLAAVGVDLNPTAAEGAAANLRHGAAAHGGQWAAGAPCVLVADAAEPLPAAARPAALVVASLPWGRDQRIPHAEYLPRLLASLAAQLRADATFVLLSAAPPDGMLAAAGLAPLATAAVGSAARQLCHVTVARAAAAANDGGGGGDDKYLTAASAAGPAATPAAPAAPVAPAEATEVLCGGGLRGATSLAEGLRRPPRAGEAVEVQCRMEDGSRRWLRARVRRAEGEACSVAWAEDDADADGSATEGRSRLPAELELCVWRGANWRFAVN